MVLHTVNAAPGNTALNDCLRCASPGDTILLLGDAVYAAVSGSTACARLESSEARILVLESDSLAAGLAADSLAYPCTDMNGFVALTEYYHRQLAWY